MAAAEAYGVRDAIEIFRERYAFYSKTYPTPHGNTRMCFHVADSPDEPVIDGIPIPKGDFEVQTEIELDLARLSVRQLKGVLGKSIHCFEISKML